MQHNRIYYYWARYIQLNRHSPAQTCLEQITAVKFDADAVNSLIQLGRFKDIYNFILNQNQWEKLGIRIDLTINQPALELLRECNWLDNSIGAGTFKSNLSFDADYAIHKLNLEIVRRSAKWESKYCSLALVELTLDSFL